MNPPVAAEQHLRVIRSLMERSTIYRALSAPAAAIGGVLSLLTAVLLATLGKHGEVSSTAFGLAWLAVFLITVTVSALLLWRDARRRAEPFLSAGARSAAKAMLPPLVAGATFSALAFLKDDRAHTLPCVWTLFYGLALLAMAHFAPRSIARLGWTFFVAGLIIATGLLDSLVDRVMPSLGETQRASLYMAGTFGLLHLLYAVCIWPRDREEQPIEL